MAGERRFMRMKKFLSPALVLFFLSPVIGELLSGSAPPAEFFNPLGLIILSVLYGGGAILARELTHRWGKGWLTLLILGAAYGIAEEGLMCKSFFDPGWMDLGILGSYGRWLGVNWVWCLELTIYHAIFSIAIPIMLVTLMFPSRREQTWIGKRKLCIVFGGWIANAVFIFIFIGKYRPPAVHYLVTMAIVVTLCILAWRLPCPRLASFAGRNRPAHTFWVLLTGFLTTLVFFIFLAWMLPNTPTHPLLTMLFMLGEVVLVSWVILKLSGGGLAWSNKHQLALASGGLIFFVLLAPMQELDKNRPDNTTGMTIVGLAIAIFLFGLMKHIRRVENRI
jgi:hypothetical protein